MARDIHLDGGEITILKLIGLSGTQVYGKLILEKIDEMEPAEFIDALEGLIDRGYVLSTKVNVRKVEDAEHAYFRVNPVYSRDLRDAVHPSRTREQKSSRRQRRR